MKRIHKLLLVTGWALIALALMSIVTGVVLTEYKSRTEVYYVSDVDFYGIEATVVYANHENGELKYRQIAYETSNATSTDIPQIGEYKYYRLDNHKFANDLLPGYVTVALVLLFMLLFVSWVFGTFVIYDEF